MIINKTKKTIIAKKYKICNSTASKAIGLMFTLKSKTLLFSWKQEKKICIHMFFVFFPIDILWLNKNKKVVQLKQNLKPFQIITSKIPAKYVIEITSGTIKRTKTRINDMVDF